MIFSCSPTLSLFFQHSNTEGYLKTSSSCSDVNLPDPAAMLAVCVYSTKTWETCTQDSFSASTSLSVSFFTFLVESATSAVTHRPASQQVSVQLQYSHITTRQFFDRIHFLPFVPKGHCYLSAVDRSDQVTATPTWTPTSLCTNILRGPSVCSSKGPPGSLFMHKAKLHLCVCVCVCHQGLVIRSDRHSSVTRCCCSGRGIFFPPMHSIGVELINLSVLLLDCTHDESGHGLDLLSEGGLSLKDGIYLDWMLQWLHRHTETQKWENHTAHQLRAGKVCVGEAAEGVDSAVSSAAKKQPSIVVFC